MTKAIRQLWNNLSSVILSLLLAVAVWVAAAVQNDPFGVQTFPSIPVTPMNQPDNTQFFEGDPAWVSIDARAQQSVLEKLKASDFTATMDLSMVEPGIVTSVPISVTTSVEAVRIELDEKPVQSVLLEALTAISVPVQIDLEGEVATGYYASTRITVDPTIVTVDGPEPYVENVVSLTGSANIAGANREIVQQVSVSPRDADGKLVTGVDWTPQQVEVRVPILRRVGYKPEVLVVPDVRGDPATGYRRGSVSVAPSTITLSGPPLVLNDLPGFVRTEPITITNMTEVLTERVPLSLPSNIFAVGVNYVTVTVSILPVLGSRLLTGPVEVQGLREEWAAILSPDTVDVILTGPDTTLSALEPEDVQVFVNLYGLGLGTHRVEPVILYPEGLEKESVLPDTIEVTIQLKATAPTATPTPVSAQPSPIGSRKYLSFSLIL